MKILIVDDERVLCECLKELLEAYDFVAEFVTSVDEALNVLKEESNKFELILSDMSLPKKDGFYLLEAIQNLDFLKPPHFVFLTGHTDVPEREVWEKGAMGILRKPLEMSDFFKILQRIQNQVTSAC